MLPFRPGLCLDWDLHPIGCLRLLSLLPLLSLGPGLCLSWRLHLVGRLRLLSLLPLLSLRPCLRLYRGLRLNLSGGRLNLPWGFAAASTLTLSPARFSSIRPGLLLPRIGWPVLMLAAGPIVRLRQCCGRAREQNGNGG